MSKPPSGLFKGTKGIDDFFGNAETVISERVKGLDLTPHPIQMKQLSSKKMAKLKSKINSRKATREEYSLYMWNKRFKMRRDKGVNSFWYDEESRLRSGQQGTRNWSSEQVKAILNGDRPKYDYQTMQGHHTYSAKEFPHLANEGAVIYPVTKLEHLKGWHGGNYRKSKPGKRIRRIREF